MRHKSLDQKLPEDTLIGELQTDENGRPFRIVNGEKIIQMTVLSPGDDELNLIINRARITGDY